MDPMTGKLYGLEGPGLDQITPPVAERLVPVSESAARRLAAGEAARAERRAARKRQRQARKHGRPQ